MVDRQGLADNVEDEIYLSWLQCPTGSPGTLMMAVIDWKWLVNGLKYKANKWLRAKVKPLNEPDFNMRLVVFHQQQNLSRDKP